LPDQDQNEPGIGEEAVDLWNNGNPTVLAYRSIRVGSEIESAWPDFAMRQQLCVPYPSLIWLTPRSFRFIPWIERSDVSEALVISDGYNLLNLSALEAERLRPGDAR
jgi:hypothetical protein